MSDANKARATPAELAVKVLALVAIVALSAVVTRFPSRDLGFAEPIAALGLLLLAGDLFSVLVDRVGLPHLTGYLLSGLLLGPHVLKVVSHEAVGSLGLVNALALALIGLSAGSHLTIDMLRRGFRSLCASIVAQVLITLPLMALFLFMLRPFIGFMAALPLSAALGLSLMWGVISVSRSPSATLAVITQLRTSGPLTRHALAFVVAFDIVVLILFSFGLQVSKTLVSGVAFTLPGLVAVVREIFASICFGITLGLLISAWLTFIKRGVIVFVVMVGYGVTLMSRALHYDTLLLFVMAGFVVANTSNVGDTLLHGVARGGRVVYVLFFALAGAHLNLPLIATLWPVALALFTGRILATAVAARVASVIAKDGPAVRRFGWMPLVSQAGAAIGMSVLVGQAFPGVGPNLQALVLATVGLNEAIGPVLFKYALQKSGETRDVLHG